MSAKEIEVWGRPLVKMTTKELREVAKEIPEITGVHGMKKEDLIDAMRRAKGIEAPRTRRPVASVKAVKEQIRSVRALRASALEANDDKKAAILRRRISRLKKKTRRAAR